MFRFLQGRGYISSDYSCAVPTNFRGNDAGITCESNVKAPLSLLNEATPLTGVDTVATEYAGIAIWKVRIGDRVTKNQLVAEIINVEDIDAPRIRLYSQCNGLVVGHGNNQLVRPGQQLMFIAGKQPLDCRSGNLLWL